MTTPSEVTEDHLLALIRGQLSSPVQRDELAKKILGDESLFEQYLSVDAGQELGVEDDAETTFDRCILGVRSEVAKFERRRLRPRVYRRWMAIAACLLLVNSLSFWFVIRTNQRTYESTISQLTNEMRAEAIARTESSSVNVITAGHMLDLSATQAVADLLESRRAKLRVAFRAIAEPRDGTRLVSFTWDKQKVDGRRLVAHVRDDSLKQLRLATAEAYDWQWAPIARLVASGDDRWLSVAGLLASTSTSRQALRYPVRYHPALENTLIGTRILRASLRCTLANQSREASVIAACLSEETPLLGSKELEDALLRRRLTVDAPSEIDFWVDHDRFVLSGEPVCGVLADDVYAAGAHGHQLSANVRQIWSSATQPRVLHIAAHGWPSAITSQPTRVVANDGAELDELTRAMRLSALFRYLSITDPPSFRSLVEQAELIELESVPTPKAVMAVESKDQ